MPEGLTGLRVVSFESRRSRELAELIRNYGGEPIQAPSMREVPLTDQHQALAFGETLLARHYDIVILLTGVGTRMLIAALSERWPRDDVVEALGRLTLVCRGPKLVAALKEVGLVLAVTVPEPNTWRDVLSEFGRSVRVEGKPVAVQEYGARNEELLSGLRHRGAVVTAVPVYGWALPEDPAPLRAAIERIVANEVEVALFTSATQVDHVFKVANGVERADALREACKRTGSSLTSGASVARPGGNVTGVSLMSPELGPKRLESCSPKPLPKRRASPFFGIPPFRDNTAELSAMQASARVVGSRSGRWR